MALCDVGWLYGEGKGVVKDPNKAFEYMEKAALAGFPRAQNNLGLYYKKGTGCRVRNKYIHYIKLFILEV